MGEKEKIIVKASIFRFLLFHTVIGISISLIYGFITKSYIDIIIVMSVFLVTAPIGFFLIDANEQTIAIDEEKVEGPGRLLIFKTERISISLDNVDLLSSKNRYWWMGGSYIASNQGKRIILNNMFLSHEQVGYIFRDLENKLTNGCT
jgi:hypothetical protein